MNHLKKGLLLCLSLAVLAVLPSCGDADDGGTSARIGENEVKEATSLTVPAKDIAAAVQAGVTLTDMDMATSDEEESDLMLMFNYGVDDDALIAAVEDFALGTLTANDYPYYIGIIRTKEGTDKATVDAIAEKVRASYPEHVIYQMGQYNSAWLGVAEKFTLKTYDNGIVVVAYDEDGNDVIFDLVNAACAK